MDPYSWSWNPEALVAIPALTAAYVWALRRSPPPPWRVACFVAAIVLLLAVTITPIETIALGYLLSVHLIQNVVLAEWAPLLAVLGIPPALARAAPRVPPVPALVLWVVNYGVWHLPWVYDAALRTRTRSSTSSTRSTSSPACCSGGRSCTARSRPA